MPIKLNLTQKFRSFHPWPAGVPAFGSKMRQNIMVERMWWNKIISLMVVTEKARGDQEEIPSIHSIAYLLKLGSVSGTFYHLPIMLPNHQWGSKPTSLKPLRAKYLSRGGFTNSEVYTPINAFLIRISVIHTPPSQR